MKRSRTEYIYVTFHGKKFIYDGPTTEINKPHGEGRLFYPEIKKLAFEGEFKNGFIHGRGTQYYTTGEIYFQGEFQNNKRNGHGRRWGRDGKILWDGQFEDDSPTEGWKYYPQLERIWPKNI